MGLNWDGLEYNEGKSVGKYATQITPTVTYGKPEGPHEVRGGLGNTLRKRTGSS